METRDRDTTVDSSFKSLESLKSLKFEFLPEHWNIIKKYAGIYHITTKWDLSKLDNNQIDTIVSFIPGKYNLRYHERIPFIWKHLDKSKLINVYSLYYNSLL